MSSIIVSHLIVAAVVSGLWIKLYVTACEHTRMIRSNAESIATTARTLTEHIELDRATASDLTRRLDEVDATITNRGHRFDQVEDYIRKHCRELSKHQSELATVFTRLDTVESITGFAGYAKAKLAEAAVTSTVVDPYNVETDGL